MLPTRSRDHPLTTGRIRREKKTYYARIHAKKHESLEELSKIRQPTYRLKSATAPGDSLIVVKCCRLTAVAIHYTSDST